ncbi:hypothetical protein BX666DRAFT_1882692 [Dichotomocladium elegans]|nr:hypothetical protein BX666DRAFT_1882692 [Dichotomocladium elegans]
MNHDNQAIICKPTEELSAREAAAVDALSRRFTRSASFRELDPNGSAADEVNSESTCHPPAQDDEDDIMEDFRLVSSDLALPSFSVVDTTHSDASEVHHCEVPLPLSQPAANSGAPICSRGRKAGKVQKRGKRGGHKTWSEDLVKTAIENHVIYGMSKADAADSIHMSPSTFHGYFKRYEESQGRSVMPAKRGSKRTADLSDAQIRFILRFVDQHPKCAIGDILSALAGEEMEGRFSQAKLQAWLRENARITFQCFQSFEDEPQVDENSQLENDFYHMSSAETFKADDNVVFIGEACFEANLRRVYPESSKPAPPNPSTTRKRIPHACVQVAFSSTGIIASSIKHFDGLTTAEEMSDFVDDVLRELKKKESKNWHLGIDYLPADVANPMMEKIKRAGWAPFLFPKTEVPWNAARFLLEDLPHYCDRKRLDPSKRETLPSRLAAAVARITPADCEGYIFRAYPTLYDAQ